MSTIKVKPWGKNQGEYVLIEESDFDANLHEKFDEEKRNKKLIEKNEAKE